MLKESLDIILALGAVVAGLAVALTCGVGLLVWLAGGKTGQHRDEEAVP